MRLLNGWQFYSCESMYAFQAHLHLRCIQARHYVGSTTYDVSACCVHCYTAVAAAAAAAAAAAVH
jgi:hypothetical protein